MQPRVDLVFKALKAHNSVVILSGNGMLRAPAVVIIERVCFLKRFVTNSFSTSFSFMLHASFHASIARMMHVAPCYLLRHTGNMYFVGMTSVRI